MGTLTMRSNFRSLAGIGDDLEIGDGVLDFLALVEARAADDAIGQPERDEAVFEGAHLERGAHQDRDLVQPVLGALRSVSMSSPMERASSSSSQTPTTVTFSPALPSVNSVLPSRPLFLAMRPEAAARMWPVER